MMQTVQISERTMERLRARSQREGRNVNVIVEEILAKTLERDPDDQPLDVEGLLAEIDAMNIQVRPPDDDESAEAQINDYVARLEARNLRSGVDDVSERSREILNHEYAEHLWKRHTAQSNEE